MIEDLEQLAKDEKVSLKEDLEYCISVDTDFGKLEFDISETVEALLNSSLDPSDVLIKFIIGLHLIKEKVENKNDE